MASTASDFSRALLKFERDARARVNDCATFAFQEVRRSVVFGSELTGAPGQPVQTSDLRTSWIGTRISVGVQELTTAMSYAEYIEDGGNDLGAFTLRSEVGGFHSVKLTVAAWDKIVEFARKKAMGAGA